MELGLNTFAWGEIVGQYARTHCKALAVLHDPSTYGRGGETGVKIGYEKGKKLVLDETINEDWLRDVRKRSSSALSGGQQQVVAIGRMLMSDPQVLLLDEPSLGLAPIAIDGVAAALAELRQRGRSLLLVEQRVDLALRVCDRVYVLAGGEVALEKLASEIHAEERSLINAYLG